MAKKIQVECNTHPNQMNPAMIFKIDYRIYVEDTDFGGVVYHANYLKFMERARTEHLANRDYSLATLAEQGYFFVVREINVSYHQPARLNQHITVTSQVHKMGASALTFYQTIEHNEQTLCEGQVVIVCVNANMKPTRLPQQLREQLQ